MSGHLFHSDKLSGLSKYSLRVILTGAVATMSRIAREDRDSSPSCPCCGMEEETTEHLFLRCAAHKVQRTSLLTEEFFQALPSCCNLHGLLPLGMDLHSDFDQNREGLKDFAYQLQHTLLAILEHRQKLVPMRMAPRRGPAEGRR